MDAFHFINSPLKFGQLEIPHRLIQGPLAGYSCAPMRELFSYYSAPAYAVSEMISAKDVLSKHHTTSRYLYRSPLEGLLAYQLSGNNPTELSLAAKKCQLLGADLIDLNCGCPKEKIRKKGAGSALLEKPYQLKTIIHSIKDSINIPLTVKIRLQTPEKDEELVKIITEAGADAIVIHGRTPHENYDTPCNYAQIKTIKKLTRIPIIANGDIENIDTLNRAITDTLADAFMIARAGCGQPWLYQSLLNPFITKKTTIHDRIELFFLHLDGLTNLENEYQALLQARSLVKYYFKPYRNLIDFKKFYLIHDKDSLKNYLYSIFKEHEVFFSSFQL
jgi:tRNA-dihydrouridine synthase B